ncbi:MAG: proprotein convertase P-domain-containing protein, partial [Bacteroidota bacterium]
MHLFPLSDLQTKLLCLFLICSNITLFAQSDPFNNPSNCGINLAIPDSTCNSTNSFRINVSGEAGTQLGSDIFLEEVRLIIAHTWIADLDISLISPNGVKVELSSDNGEAEDNYGDPSDVTCGSYLSFSASACNPIESITTPPFVGEYQAEGNLFDFNDGSNPNGQWILEICDDAGDDAGTLEFVALVFSPVACLAPSDVRLVSTDSTTVVLDWRSSDNCNNTIIEYGTPGFTPGTSASAGGGTVVIADCPPFQLSGLAAYTDYDIYIREICDNGNFSSNSCPLFIQTSCAPPPISQSETFDSQTICDNFCGRACDISGLWQNDPNDNFDWTIFTEATPSANTGPSHDVEANGNYIYIETSGSSCRDGNQAILRSNCIQIDDKGVDSCHFSFNYHMLGSSVNRLRLQISTDGGGNWATIWEEAGNKGDQWLKQYISLAEWNGQIVRFRFIGEGGSGAAGDIALDNLVFYGSQDLGAPSNRFYADLDMDGYGDPENFIESCVSVLPNGFVSNDLDCDDTNDQINPDAVEIACNGIDDNCNGIDDDFIIPAPNTTSTSVCSGEEARVTAEVPTDGFILWFASPDSLDVLAFDDGTGYTETLTTEGDTLVRIVYAEAWQGLDCQSLSRTPTTITVYPKPQLAVAAPPVICSGESLNLSELTLIDQNNSNATITFHSDIPDTDNILDSLMVSPETSTAYFIQATTSQGCTDVISFDVQVGGDAAVSISPSADTLSVCSGSLQTLEAIAMDTSIAYTYVWSTGAVGDSIAVQGSNTAGDVELITLSITDARGCMTMDSVWLRASTGISSARVVPTEVTACGGRDGSILVEPLSGTPPFDYFWSGTSNGSAENVEGTYTIENLAQGTYRVTVVDNSSLGCDIQLPFTLVNGPNAKVSLASKEMVTCKDGADGQICIEVAGLDPQIRWSNGATTACVDSLSAGRYSVTVTDGICETVLSDIEIEQPSSIQIAAILTAPSCHDASNGSIELTTSGGTFPYTYFWQDSSLNTANRANLKAGDYELTILDANNCSSVYEIPLNAPDTLEIVNATIQNMSCFEVENGVVAPNVRGGTAPYFYEWSNGAFEDAIANLNAGIYALTVTDVNG